MLPELMRLLPDLIGDCSLAVAIGGALIGLGFWLAGARFSRSLVTLVGVAIGTSVGMRLPGWLGWSIDGMAIGVGGAVLLGVTGYVLHRTWIAFYLGTLFALWAIAASWIAFSGTQSVVQLSVDWKTGILTGFESMWDQLPTRLAHAFGIAAGVGLLAGAAMTILWPRLSRVTTWSLAGVTLLVSMFGAAEQTTHSTWVAAIKFNDALAASALVGLVVVGALIQWLLTTGGSAHRSAPRKSPLPMDD